MVNGATSNLTPRDGAALNSTAMVNGATSNLTPRDGAALNSTAMVNGATSNLTPRDGAAHKKGKKSVTLIDSRDSRDSQLFPSIDDTSEKKLPEIYNVIDSSITFNDLQQNLRKHGINITPETISINIRQK
jgi:hypothetical protein